MDIPQPNFFTVNLVLAITTAIDMALDTDFLASLLDKLVLIIQNHNDRSIVEGLAILRPCKNDIGHLTAPQTLNTRLTQSPAQALCNVGLA